MRIVVLASGSSGNVTFVENKDTRILIDAGKSCHYIETKLKDIGIDPYTINAILITHTHNDHINGIKTFYKKYKPCIYIMPKALPVLNNILEENFNYQYFSSTTKIDNFSIDIIKTSHDVPDSVGFIINDILVYITDTGYLNKKLLPKLSNKKIYIMESNHDMEMLMNGNYPHYLKQRIWSDEGHLSNEASSHYLKELIGKDTNHIVLAHLSENNNTKDKALETLLGIIDTRKDLNITVAEQNERTEVIEV